MLDFQAQTWEDTGSRSGEARPQTRPADRRDDMTERETIQTLQATDRETSTSHTRTYSTQRPAERLVDSVPGFREYLEDTYPDGLPCLEVIREELPEYLEQR